MKNAKRRAFRTLVTVVLVLGMLLQMQPVFAETTTPDSKIVWDMENLPDDLFVADWAWDQDPASAGHNNGAFDILKAEGKGVDGSTAVEVRYYESTTNLHLNGFYLRIDQDETADADWYGAETFWFYMDASQFKNDISLDLMIDGVFPAEAAPVKYISGGRETMMATEPMKDRSGYGAIKVKAGFVGYIGIDFSAFGTIFGKVQNVGFTLHYGSESRPLSAYFDDFSVSYRANYKEGNIRLEGDLYNEGIAKSDNILYTDLTYYYQTVQNFGASSAWWTADGGLYPSIDNALDLLYTDKGIAMNTFRFEIGASVKSDFTDSRFPDSSKSTLSPLTEIGTYDETRDKGSYSTLMKVKELGTVTDFTLFINSPPATMTVSGKSDGDPWNAGKTNLREDCIDEFVSYCVDVVELYLSIGIPVRYISPINEPQWHWSGAGQEGCHYKPLEIMNIYHLLAVELNERTKDNPYLADVKIIISESAQWGMEEYTTYIVSQMLLDEDIMSRVDSFGAHSYSGTEEIKRKFVQQLKNVGVTLPLHQTEFATGAPESDFSMKSAIEVARVINEDLSILNVESWAFWRAASQSGIYTDALIYLNPHSEDVLASKRLWVMGNFSKYITGATRVETDTTDLPSNMWASGYAKGDDGSLIYVVGNSGMVDRTFSFVGFPEGTVAEVHETSPLRNLEYRGTVTTDCGIPVPALSVTTFVFKDIDYETFMSGSNPENKTALVTKQDFDFSVYKTVTADNNPNIDIDVKPAFTVGVEIMYIGLVLVTVGVIGFVCTVLKRKKKA